MQGFTSPSQWKRSPDPNKFVRGGLAKIGEVGDPSVGNFGVGWDQTNVRIHHTLYK